MQGAFRFRSGQTGPGLRETAHLADHRIRRPECRRRVTGLATVGAGQQLAGAGGPREWSCLGASRGALSDPQRALLVSASA
jgi:hypothetical protein